MEKIKNYKEKKIGKNNVKKLVNKKYSKISFVPAAKVKFIA